MKVICLSGGLDSAVALLISPEAFDLALTFDYGQTRAGHGEPPEVSAARNIADRAGVPHEIITVKWGECPPKAGLLGGHVDTAVSSVVPGRNTSFIALAAMRGATSVTLGCNGDDQAAYRDCRKEVLMSVGRACGVRINLPLELLSKREILHISKDCALHIDDTVTCYRGTDCGECASCRLLKSVIDGHQA